MSGIGFKQSSEVAKDPLGHKLAFHVGYGLTVLTHVPTIVSAGVGVWAGTIFPFSQWMFECLSRDRHCLRCAGLCSLFLYKILSGCFFITTLDPRKSKWIDDVFAYHLWKVKDPTGYDSRCHRVKTWATFRKSIREPVVVMIQHSSKWCRLYGYCLDWTPGSNYVLATWA